MRPIKFRIPFFNSKDGSFSHFGYWGAIDNNGKPIYDHGSFYSPSQSSACSKGWHEQFTGLFDKEGKEIYEGDIVDLQPDQDDKIWHRVVKYNTSAFHFRAIHTSANHPLYFHKFARDRKLIIICNIHENPELL